MNASTLPGMFAAIILLIAPSAAQAGPFQTAAVAVDITPGDDVLLDGTIMKIGPAKGVHDRLHARCIAISDGVTSVGIAIIDNTMIAREILDDARRQAARLTGLPQANFLLAATHSHSTPRAVDIQQGPANEAYHEQLARRTAEGLAAAFKKLRPSAIGFGRFDEPRFVHNRRWFMTEAFRRPNPFGETGDQVWMNPPSGDALVKPAGPVDAQVSVLAARDPNGAPVFLLGNYGVHYIGGIPGGQISADYFGVFSERIGELIATPDQKPPFVGLMSNGTSGDVNAINFSAPRKRYPPYARMTEVAHVLAAQAKSVYSHAPFAREGVVKVATAELKLAVRKPDAARLKWARETLAQADPKKRPTRPEIYAREALGLAEYPGYVSLMLQAVRIGDIAIAAIPNEVFAETGLAIKAASPFAKTFVIELANGYSGYLPTAEQHRWGGYETWPARSSFLETEAETKIRRTAIQLLHQLK